MIYDFQPDNDYNAITCSYIYMYMYPIIFTGSHLFAWTSGAEVEAVNFLLALTEHHSLMITRASPLALVCDTLNLIMETNEVSKYESEIVYIMSLFAGFLVQAAYTW